MAKHVTARLPEDLVERIDIAARVAGQSRSDWIAATLAKAVEGSAPARVRDETPSRSDARSLKVAEQKADWLVRLMLGIITHGNRDEFEKLLAEYEALA